MSLQHLVVSKKMGEGGGTGWSGVEGRGENADNCN